MINKCLKYFYIKQHTLISIEGNIGSGKSTLLKLMQQKYPQMHYLPEPVNEWQQINGNPKLNLLGSFYQDPHRWAYTMQNYAFYSRLKHWKTVMANLNESIILSERSIQADKEIFAKNGYINGLMNEMEFAIYEQFYNWLVQEVFGKQIAKQLIVYLQVNPNVCLQRMLKRSRNEEKNSISKDYLVQIHQRHEEWLINTQNQNQKVLILNGDKEFEGDLKQQQIMFEQINQFFSGLV
ncbi:unnamed protein product [Paramecium pentaurelia]|uniref:Deoxynucleoside kinase domain-containing protein n=1 Tax=Paramecium pentaurelia TaxID=43138 RepID=A0A8S1WZE0_9CILI|nr:unnamed protein product [Paramecium pentaurelia]